jgi:hypothetical protein
MPCGAELLYDPERSASMDFVNVDHMLKDAIDMHMHPGPGPMARLDAMEAAKQALQAGMKAIVLKSHPGGVAMANMVSQLVPGIKVLGSVTLNYEAGGLNPYAVSSAALYGAKVVWMPTFASSNSINKMRGLGLPLEGEGISLLDKTGKLVPEVHRILALVKKYDMVLATGHISPQETLVLFNEAQNVGIKKLFITHPTDAEFSEKILTISELKQLAKIGAYSEFTLVGMLPNEFCHDPAKIVENIKAIGPEHCIISTDMGQPQNPTPVEGMRLFIATLLHHGLTQKEIELLVKVNPARLLGLE